MSLLPEGRGIAVYISLGWLVTILIIFGFALLNPLQINSSSLQQQLALTAKCLLVCIFWLIVSIGRLAKLRFFSREDIEGSGLTLGSEQAHILQAILTNTCEQTLLACLVYLAWTLCMPVALSGALVGAATLFFCGRAFFTYNYAYGAVSRAFGFAITFYPSILLFIWTTIHLLYQAYLVIATQL